MGTFLTELVCKINSRDKVIDAISRIMKDKGFQLISKRKVRDGIKLVNQYDVTKAENGWVQIFCPDEELDDSIPKELSKKLDTIVFQFHIHDGDFWMYQLFVSGKLRDKHNPIPDYWENINKEEKEKWRGNTSLLASILDVQESKIKPYLVFWSEVKSNKKAFSNDESPIKNEWAMTDFQKKFGILYPDFDKPKTLDIIRLSFKPKK